MPRKYWDDEAYYPQPTTDEIRVNAMLANEKATKKGKVYSPVILEGRTIATSWWGKAWCQNLESYADFESRLPRGQRYVRAGAVIDLQIKKGLIQAKVQGSRRAPYKVEIRISPLSQERCDNIMERCAGQVGSLEELLKGDFPEHLKDLFLGEGGLFPEPREIAFMCSCPDWALMCKHVAAALYGVGARLDHDPLMFFTLRGIEVNRFVDTVMYNYVDEMLEHADVQTDRIIASDSWQDLFGIS